MRNRQNPATSLRIRHVAMVLASAAFIALIGSTITAGPLDQRLTSQGPGVSNHPVNIVPSSGIRIPADWPLSPDGSITCRTCHTALPALNSSADAKLRGNVDSRRGSFCSNCHTDSRSGSAAAMHWLAVPRAHIHEDSGRSAGSAGRIDRQSAECLSCHDGVNAGETAYETGGHLTGGYGDARRNHPIGVRYPKQGTTRTEVPLRPTSMLPPTVRLPGGTVSCISCHDLYNMDSKRLSVPITESQLCFTCHNMN